MNQSIENEEEVVGFVDSESRSSNQSHHKYAKLISNYEDVNEKLRRELEELQNQRLENKSDLDPEDNEQALKELAQVQNLLEDRNTAFIAISLEAALWHRVTSMFETEQTTRRLIQGRLKIHRTGLTKLKKNTWVEVYFSIGKALKNEYKAGYVRLTHADSKDAETFNQCLVTEIFVDEANTNNFTFTARVSSGGRLKELMFGCETEAQRSEWVKCITEALTDVRETYSLHKERYTLKLYFAKEKIGLLIKERILEKNNADEKSGEESKIEGCAEKETSKAIEKEMKEEEEEQPCELLVIEIVDQDLKDSGLQVDSILRAINDTVLVGKLCSEQLKLLAETPKPFVLTFTGRNFTKKNTSLNSCVTHGYFSILNKLVTFGDNDVKDTLNTMVTGTLFEKELKSSKDKNETISALLGNQRRLIDLLQNISAKSGKEEEQEYKE